MAKAIRKNIFLKNWLISVFVILAVICAFLINFTYIPLARKLGDIRTRYRQETSRLEKIKGEVSTADKIKAKIIIYSQDLSQALDELTKRANGLGVEFDLLKPQEPIGLGKDYQVLPILIESACSFEALGSFLGSLEDLTESVVVLNRLEIVREQDLLPDLKVSLELGMYLAL